MACVFRLASRGARSRWRHTDRAPSRCRTPDFGANRAALNRNRTRGHLAPSCPAPSNGAAARIAPCIALAARATIAIAGLAILKQPLVPNVAGATKYEGSARRPQSTGAVVAPSTTLQANGVQLQAWQPGAATAGGTPWSGPWG